MKMNGWITLSLALLAVTLSGRADGQLDAAPAPQKTTKPAPVAKPATVLEQPVVLSPGAAKVVGKNVNVRGKAGFVGEVVAKLQDGDAVTVLEQVILTKPKAGEPAQWAKIVYPASAHVWVHGSYLNADNTVKPRKLNVRTGPGENYSVVGTIEQGTAVSVVSTKGNWTQIQAPAAAFAYVSASFVRQDGAIAAAAPPVVTLQVPDPTPTTITGGPTLASTTTDDPAEPVPTIIEDTTATAVPPPVVEEVWVPRTVSHEGIVRGTISIQAPTRYGLYSKENGKLINFLYSPTPQLELSKYFNRHIIVSGQEGLEERWKNTPILTIQKIYVVE